MIYNNGRCRLYAFLLSFSFSISAFASPDDSGVDTVWGYKGNIGPARWAQLDPDFAACAVGLEQSPIDIIKKTVPAAYTLELKYHPASLDIMRDGATLLAIGKQQAIVNTGHGVQINFHAKDHEYVKFANKEYSLIQFHFHSPSENQLNGESFPLEIHFVNQSSDGEVLALAVFVKGGKANKTIGKIIKNLPKTTGDEHIILGEKINPQKLFPAIKDYFSFPGSLTFPPCTEGVQWVVLEQPIVASPAQIAFLRKAMQGGNARPVQALHERTITYSKEPLKVRISTYFGAWLPFLKN